MVSEIDTVTFNFEGNYDLDQVTIDLSNPQKIVMAAEDFTGEVSLYTPEQFQEKFPVEAYKIIEDITAKDASTFFHGLTGNIDPKNLPEVINELYDKSKPGVTDFEAEVTLGVQPQFKPPNL